MRREEPLRRGLMLSTRYESKQHQSNAKAGEVIGSNVLAEMVQRVCLNGEDAKAVVADTATKLEEIMAR